MAESIAEALRRRAQRFRAPAAPLDTTPTFRRGQALVPAANIQAAVQGAQPAAPPVPKKRTIKDRIRDAIEAAGATLDIGPTELQASPVLGGIGLGISGISDTIKRRRKRREKEEEEAQRIPRIEEEETARARARQPFRQAEESRRQAGRSSLLRERFGLSSDLAKKRAAQRAGALKLSVGDAQKVYDDAQRELFFQQVFPDSPGYSTLLDTRANQIASKFKGLGVKALTPKLGVPAPKGDELDNILFGR